MASRRRDRSNWGANMTTPYLQKIKREAAQAAYVAAWRAEHPAEMFVDAWMCPFCKSAVQVAVTPREFAWDQGEQIEAHQQSHGDDWTAYLEAGE